MARVRFDLNSSELRILRDVTTRLGPATTVSQIQYILNELGENLSEHEVLNELNTCNCDLGVGPVPFETFVRMFERRKKDYLELTNDPDRDTIEAFAAMGGKKDGTGSIPVDVVKEALNFFPDQRHIDALLERLQGENNNMTFKDFKNLSAVLQDERGGGGPQLSHDASWGRQRLFSFGLSSDSNRKSVVFTASKSDEAESTDTDDESSKEMVGGQRRTIVEVLRSHSSRVLQYATKANSSLRSRSISTYKKIDEVKMIGVPNLADITPKYRPVSIVHATGEKALHIKPIKVYEGIPPSCVVRREVALKPYYDSAVLMFEETKANHKDAYWVPSPVERRRTPVTPIRWRSESKVAKFVKQSTNHHQKQSIADLQEGCDEDDFVRALANIKPVQGRPLSAARKEEIRKKFQKEKTKSKCRNLFV